jgi:glycosyltransferase involved in cell wall biosynthesis
MAMKIGVLSDCRQPTVGKGGHGLGRMAIDIAEGLKRYGHNVVLYAGPGSEWGGDVVCHENETLRAQSLAEPENHGFMIDAWIDLSHNHDLSRLCPRWKVVNWVVDTECKYTPPNAVVGNAWQKQYFPSAKIIPLGIDVDKIPLGMGGENLVFVAKIHANKGADIAMAAAKKAGKILKMYGQVWTDIDPPNYCGVIDDDAKLFAILGGAAGLLSPSRVDAGGRVNLEAAACGTGVLCLEGTGTACHVEHGVSGWICADEAEIVDAVQDLAHLDRKTMREWVRDTHDISVMVDKVLMALCAVRDGERW